MHDVAYAQGAGASAGGGFSMLVPLVLMFLVFYFLLIRPQQKKQRTHQDMLKSLRVGDKVITSGGICGTIVDGGDPLLKLEIADKIKVEVGRAYIAGRIGPLKDGESSGGGPQGSSSESKGVGGFLGKLFGR
ncbi:MAG: preprotein translocase subunit YajC [Candidatus Methylomirabilota bacterium]